MVNYMRSIGIFTSGGDAPGMNAAIRSVVRTSIYHGVKPYGIARGYQGLIKGEVKEMNTHSVSSIIQRGGTILKSARSTEFYTKEGRKKAFDTISKFGLDGLKAIGGDGTFTGARIFTEEYGIPFIGIPGTIDNDLYGTDYTIGYDTALNTVVQMVDRIRDTASSHNRLFFIEVMGKDAGFIALRSGVSVGAEAILIPETSTYIDQLVDKLRNKWKRQKSSLIIIVAEGDESGGAYKVAAKVREQFDQYDTRVTVLGHVQRGGSPSAMDRVLASQLGLAAVNALLDGKKGVMVGIVNKEIQYTPFERATKHHDKLNMDLLHLAELLAS
ncbi:MAG: 6-phosphofructokinase [Flavobacteriales bacterium]|nr:6-phosphofructokinase [Flavobacteriales bacterium]